MFKFSPPPEPSPKDLAELKQARDEASKSNGWLASTLDAKAREKVEGNNVKVVCPAMPKQMHFTLSSMLNLLRGENKSAVLTGDMVSAALREYGRFVHSTDFSSEADILYRLSEGMPDLEKLVSDLRELSPEEFNLKWGMTLACSVMALSAVFERIMSSTEDHQKLQAVWLRLTKSTKEGNK